MVADCAKFQRDNMALLTAAHGTGKYGAGCRYDAWDTHGDGWHSTADLAGYDFWLTRNGHGTGFWDRGLGNIGKRLAGRAAECGSADLYVGDDGRIWA